MRADHCFARGGGAKRGIEFATAEITVAARHRVGVAIAQERRNVAFTVRKVRAHQHIESALPAIGTGSSGRRGVIEVPHQILHVRVMVVVVVLVVLAVKLNALEVLLHDEVDDACDGVGTVSCRRSASDDFDSLDQAGGTKATRYPEYDQLFQGGVLNGTIAIGMASD